MKTPYKNPLFKNLSPYPGGIHKIQDASTLRTLGHPSLGGQVLILLGSFPHQGNLESKTNFQNPPHKHTLCLSIMSVCWVDTAGHATAQWLCMRSRSTRLLFRTLLVSCRLGLQPPAASCPACALLTPRLPSTFPNAMPALQCHCTRSPTRQDVRHSRPHVMSQKSKSPKARKALHSAVVLPMCPCDKGLCYDAGKNVAKNLSLP